MNRIPKYKFMTGLLAIYALFMTLYFGLDLLRSGHALRFWLTVAGETLCITLTFFALRRRDRLKQERLTREGLDKEERLRQESLDNEKSKLESK